MGIFKRGKIRPLTRLLMPVDEFAFVFFWCVTLDVTVHKNSSMEASDN